MKKNEILKGISEVQHDLQKSKNKLDELVSIPIWDETVSEELDETVTILQGLNQAINDLVDIQRKVLLKEK